VAVTVRLYYEDAYIREFRAKLTSVKTDGEKLYLTLDATAFYPEGGGQPCDMGVIKGQGWTLTVEEVHTEGDEIVHIGRLDGRQPQPGEEVSCAIDWDRRYRLMRMHTTAHILGYCIKEIYGREASFAGGSLGVEQSFDDFSARIPRADLPKIEDMINEIVSRDLPIKIFWLPRPEAESYLSRFGEKLTELHAGISDVRIVEIEGVYACACGGTHLRRTGEVGRVKLLKRESKGRGITRIRYTLV